MRVRRAVLIFRNVRELSGRKQAGAIYLTIRLALSLGEDPIRTENDTEERARARAVKERF